MLPALLTLALLAPAPQQDAITLAHRTAEVLDATVSLTFDFEQYQVTDSGERTLAARGSGRVSAPTAERGTLAFLEGELLTGDTPAPFVLWTDGDRVRVHDGSRNTVWTSRMHRTGVILLDQHGLGVIGPLTASSTYSNLAQYGPELGDPVDHAGVPCQSIRVPLPGGVEYRALVGTDDALPRLMSRPQGEVVLENTWSQLVPGDAPVRLPTAPPVPEGWQERPFTLGGPALGEPAPPFDLEDDIGTRHVLADLKDRVVLLDFWATWCAPCVASMPGLATLARDFADRDVLVLGARWSDSGDPSALLEKLGVDYPIVDGSSIGKAYGVDRSGIPALFVLVDGKVVDYFLGYEGAITEARLRQLVTDLTAP